MSLPGGRLTPDGRLIDLLRRNQQRDLGPASPEFPADGQTRKQVSTGSPQAMATWVLATWVLATWVLEPGLDLIGLAGFPVLRFRMDYFRWGEVPETSPVRGGRSRVGVLRGLAC